MTFFNTFNGIYTGKTVNPKRQMFGMIFHDAEGKNNRCIFFDGFTNLIRQHIEVLHDFSPKD